MILHLACIVNVHMIIILLMLQCGQTVKHWKSSIQESKPRFTSLSLMLRQSLNETHPSIQSIRFILDPEENFHIHNISLSPLVSRVMTAIIPIALWMNLFQVQYEKAVYGVINLISDIKYRKIFPSTKRKNDNLDWQTLNIMILLICWVEICENRNLSDFRLSDPEEN